VAVLRDLILASNSCPGVGHCGRLAHIELGLSLHRIVPSSSHCLELRTGFLSALDTTNASDYCYLVEAMRNMRKNDHIVSPRISQVAQRVEKDV
jgi:hypothetical protein